jgi:hypothetical protein
VNANQRLLVTFFLGIFGVHRPFGISPLATNRPMVSGVPGPPGFSRGLPPVALRGKNVTSGNGVEWSRAARS